MIAFELPEVKQCMSKLLLSDTFDNFSFIEGEITTSTTYTFDGFLHKEFFDSDEQELLENQYTLWKSLREFCFSIIKGKRTPLHMKLVFSLSKKNIASLIEKEQLGVTPEQVQGLYLNFRYDGSALQCVTGVSLNIFSLDKSLEHLWDDMVRKFFAKHEILFREAE